MNLLTITAIDRDSSDTMSRTFNSDSIHHFKKNVKEWENEIPYRKYELTTSEFIEDYPNSEELKFMLDELEVTF